MTILVIDGQGGKLGKRLVESIKKSFPQVEVMAVGTNSAASESMMRAGADRVATGENPVIVASRTAQIIVGPMGIALADALMGEISPAMANTIATMTLVDAPLRVVAVTLVNFLSAMAGNSM